MRILIVCSGNANRISPFVSEQADALMAIGVDIDYLVVRGKGILGYLKSFLQLLKKIKLFNPDIVHAHYGLSGLAAVLQRRVPVVITFHGSDAYISWVKILSKLASVISEFNIYVEEQIKHRISMSEKKCMVLPCGIDLELFHSISMNEARAKLGLDDAKQYLLFSSRFDNPVKNYQLAQNAINILGNKNIEIIELKNRSRSEVNLLFNACNAAILTSFSEGSPQFIKEAMACNCPIVATDVGDIKDIIGDTEGCYITTFDPKDVAEKIQLAITFSQTVGRTRGRENIYQFDNKLIAKQIHNIYQSVLDRTV